MITSMVCPWHHALEPSGNGQREPKNATLNARQPLVKFVFSTFCLDSNFIIRFQKYIHTIQPVHTS